MVDAQSAAEEFPIPLGVSEVERVRAAFVAGASWAAEQHPAPPTREQVAEVLARCEGDEAAFEGDDHVMAEAWAEMRRFYLKRADAVLALWGAPVESPGEEWSAAEVKRRIGYRTKAQYDAEEADR